ncbi:hypothetical protein [Candidatus Protochlamydia phocaeensis]|uniref:hypothetical protein n=1 Tax=Candidatus Protochlamydia phocaeensis TaxID=1414722 RepID=UPI000838C864|nr:hypothetical protein [Candidatus Protochlamydia phocaeensis]
MTSPTPNVTFDDGFNQASFLDSLQYIPTAVTNFTYPQAVTNYYNQNGLSPLPTSFLPFNTGNELSSLENGLSVAQDFDNYLSGYSLPQTPGATTPTKAFTDYSSFAAGWYQYMQSPNNGGLYQGLLNDFATAMGISLGSNNQMVAGDWIYLNKSPGVSPPIDFTSPSATNNPMIMAFQKFLAQYKYPPGGQASSGSNLPYYTDFINQWHQWLGGIATLSNGNTLASYQAFYNSFAKNTSLPDFTARLQKFYEDEVAKNGYFLPSQMFSDWVDTIRNENGLNVNTALIGSSLAGNDSEKAIILNRIILLLISMIQTLQNVGIAQANRLTYVTQYQNAYTGLQTQVPVFLKDGSNPIGGSSTEAGQARNDLNSSFNGILTDNLRSLRGIQEDNAKKLQSNVNTTNDAVNQQTDMATTFLQQLNTLLSTILR